MEQKEAKKKEQCGSTGQDSRRRKGKSGGTPSTELTETEESGRYIIQTR